MAILSGSGDRPKEKVTTMSAWILRIAAAIFDILKAFFTFFVITAPLTVGLAATVYAGSNFWLSWIPSWLVGTVATAAAGTVAAFAAPYLIAFGLIMATVIGFMGGFFLATWLWLICKVPPWKNGGKSALWMMLGWGASMIPFIDLFPTLSITTWRLISIERKEYKKELQQWQNATLLAQQQQQAREQQIVRAQQGQLAYEQQMAALQQAANDNEESTGQQERAA